MANNIVRYAVNIVSPTVGKLMGCPFNCSCGGPKRRPGRPTIRLTEDHEDDLCRELCGSLFPHQHIPAVACPFDNVIARQVYELTIHELMMIFGKEMHNGKANVFVDNEMKFKKAKK